MGLIAASAASVTGGATATGAILSVAKLAVSIRGTAATAMVLTGGKVNSSTNGSVSSDITSVYVGAGTVASSSISPTGAAGSTMVVAVYTGTNVTALTPTAGTLIGIWTLTVVASNASGVYSPTYSTVAVQPAIGKGVAPSSTLSYDSLSAVSNGNKANIYVALADAYGIPLSSGTISASATNGALIAFGSTGVEGYTASTSYDTTGTNGTYLNLVQAVANTAGSTTVTISHNGSVVGTKTISWTGDAASLTVSADGDSIFAQGTPAETDGVLYIVKDAAGNAITWAGNVTVTAGTGSMMGANGTGTNMSAALGYGTLTMNVPSSDLYGAGTYQLKLTNAAGATIKSAATNATVAGDAYSFTAAWDKTAYTSGEIAVLTITLKDSKGNLVADGSTLGGTTAVNVNTGGLTLLSSTCGAGSAIYGGKKTCKFAVLNTAGSYAYSVAVPTGSLQSATLGSVAIGNGGVSNADVLKAIVSLIASINKQIAALQKALLKKK